MKRLLLLALLLLSTVPSFGAWVLVQSTGGGKVSAASSSFSFGSTPTVGDIIIVYAQRVNNSSNGVPFITDNQGNPYSVSNYFPTGGGSQTALYCATATVASGTFTVTATPLGADFITMFIRDYTGGSCNLDQVSSANSGATSPYSCGSITTLNANDLLVTGILNNGGGTVTYTAPSGFGNLEQETNGSLFESGAVADEIVSSTGTFTPTWSVTANSQSYCVLAAFRQASGGGGTTVVSGSFVAGD